jgi:hypothetical protein
MSLGLGELPPELQAGGSVASPLEAAIPDVAPEDVVELEPVHEPMGVGSASSQDEGPADFSALLESLDISADDTTPVSVAVGESAVVDDELLQAPAAEPGGVISTDAFMDEIALDQELAFSGDLGDELSALTGADRPARPSASVRQIPAEGEATLQMDARVDRDTLMKIIDGIKNL